MSGKIPVDIQRIAAAMRQGDKSVKHFNRRTGAVLNNGDLERAKQGLDCDGTARLMCDLAPIPQIEARTMFGWIREWLDGPAARLPDPRPARGTADDRTFREKLVDDITGSGAFGRFKRALDEQGREVWRQSWDTFRAARLANEARRWLDGIGQTYTEIGTGTNANAA